MQQERGESPKALISVSDKRGVVALAKALTLAGYEIISTGGTARHLRDAGVAVREVSALTGAPELLDGRVKTLHPIIHGGLLARRDDPEHVRQMQANGLPDLRVVVVNLYPFEAVAARADATLPELVEQIDIGGPTMLRAAAKNHASISVVVDPDDYARVAEALSEGGPDAATRLELARKVFEHTARYDALIAQTLTVYEQPCDEVATELPARAVVNLERREVLRYGENPHQRAARYDAPGAAELGGVQQLHGKALSLNNLVDLDAALHLIAEFKADPTVAILKHTNPCGCAQAETIEAAYTRALACDATSAFGGIVTINRPVTAALAELLHDHFYEVICAPGFDADALALLTRKKSVRLMQTPASLSLPEVLWRRTALGWLAQDADAPIAGDALAQATVATRRAPTDAERAALAFAWRVCKHVKSNAIVLARDTATIGVGAGQMSRVDAVQLAVRFATDKAQVGAAGAVLASDAFFPFADGPEAAADAGVTAIVQPGGSRRDQEVIDACDARGIAMLLTHARHFRH